jgi:ectoine hydroxylase-related dioxygenase (phytanoyl-CoA dioxygenase family)
MAAVKWAEPTPAPPTGLTPEQVGSWRGAGFALVDDVIPGELLERAVADARDAFPEPGSEAAKRVTDFGSGGRMTFPSRSEAVNAITLHPRLLGAVAQLLDVPVAELRLTQSDLWAKYAREDGPGSRYDNADQRIHVDYPNHTLTHPPRWDRPEAVEIILYLSDVADCGGATALVPRNGPNDPAYPWPIVRTPGVGALDWLNDRASAEAYLEREAPEIAKWRAEHLYPREVRARYRPGTLLLYRHDTWHRGTPLEPGAMRLAQNLTFRKAASEWISTLHPGWAWGMYSRPKTLERLIASASVEQRCVLGFPAPGSDYWTRETLDAVAARYAPLGMDLAPYER